MPSFSPLHRLLRLLYPPFVPPPPSRFFHLPALPRASVVLCTRRGRLTLAHPRALLTLQLTGPSCMVSFELTSAHPDKNTWTRARYFGKNSLHRHERATSGCFAFCSQRGVKVCKNVCFSATVISSLF